MINEDLKLLTTILSKIKEIKNICLMFSSREEFSCNDSYIMMGVGILTELTSISEKISALTVLSSNYLTKELPLLNRYKECIFNKDNSINAYKLYDFLTLELLDLEREITELIIK